MEKSSHFSVFNNDKVINSTLAWILKLQRKEITSIFPSRYSQTLFHFLSRAYIFHIKILCLHLLILFVLFSPSCMNFCLSGATTRVYLHIHIDIHIHIYIAFWGHLLLQSISFSLMVRRRTGRRISCPAPTVTEWAFPSAFIPALTHGSQSVCVNAYKVYWLPRFSNPQGVRQVLPIPWSSFLFCFIDYLFFQRGREKEGQREREKPKQAPHSAQSPVGLGLTTLSS